MRRILLIAIAILTVSCSTVDELPIVKKDEPPTASAINKKKEVEETKAKEMEKTHAEENQQIEANYREALKTNICEKKYWSRYEFGGYFQSLADRNKITPYDVIEGDAYARRNISPLIWNEALENYMKYLGSHMPEPLSKKFDQEFDSEDMKTKNQKTVFNISIKRDYHCYKKLK